MNFLKKYPIPIAGLILATFALGNLLQSYSTQLRFVIGAIGFILYAVYIIKVLVLNVKLKEPLENPVFASVFPTITMATMLLSTYLKPYSQQATNIVWFVGVIGHFLLIIWFSFKFLTKFSIKKVFPSWYIVYVGIAVASVTAPVVQQLKIGQLSFWFAFVSYFVLVPIVCYRVFVVKEVPEPAKPTFVILSAPASLLLAGYLNTFVAKNYYIVLLLFIFSMFFYVVALGGLIKHLKPKFSPAYSGFTFPLVITAISTKLFNGYLAKLKGSPNSLLKLLVNVQEFLAAAIVLYVLIGYICFMFKKEQ